MVANTSGTVLRKINVGILSLFSGKYGFGNYLDKSLMSADGAASKEAGELVKRARVLAIAEEVYK